MPCKTYDLSVKVRPWEFGSSPTYLEGGVITPATIYIKVVIPAKAGIKN